MTTLPIVSRELGVAARRAGTYWMRCVAALVVLGVFVLLFTATQNISPAQLGQHIFTALSILALGFSMLAGVFLTSDCLSSEKREGTLGLLFLTDLRPHDIILGKLVATSLHACFGLLAIFPILGLPLLMGGITGQEFARLLLVFAVTLFCSLGIGMFVSAATHEAKHAIVSAFFLVGLIFGMLPTLWWMQSHFLKSGWLDFLLWPSPVFAYVKSTEAGYRTSFGASEFWRSVATIGFLGLTGVGMANRMLPRFWQEQCSLFGTRFGWIRRFYTKLSPAQVPLEKAASEAPLFASFRLYREPEPVRLALGDNPGYWLAARDGKSARMARLALWLMVPLWFCFLIMSLTISSSAGREQLFMAAMCIAYVLQFTIKLLVAAEAGRRLNLDRQSGALELLLSTPLSMQSLFEGQRAALKAHFRKTLLSLTLINALFILTVLTCSTTLHMNGEVQVIFSEIFIGGIIILYLDFKALTWVGMWRGLNTRQHHRAVMWTLAQVLGIPLLSIFLLIFIRAGIGSATSIFFLIGGWFAFGIVVDNISIQWARARL